MSNITQEDIADKAEQIFHDVYGKYCTTLEQQVVAKKLGEAHVTWNVMAEIFVHVAHGADWGKVASDIEGRWKRGTKPKSSKKQKTKPPTLEGDLVPHRQEELTSLRNKVNDLRYKSRRIDFSVRQVAPLWGNQCH